MPIVVLINQDTKNLHLIHQGDWMPKNTTYMQLHKSPTSDARGLVWSQAPPAQLGLPQPWPAPYAERRFDAGGSETLTKAEFVSRYGTDRGATLWDAGFPAM